MISHIDGFFFSSKLVFNIEMLVIVWNYFGLVSYSEYLILLKN